MLNVDRAKRVIVRCCSTQNTLLHVPPEHRRFRRIHGLQLPLHPQQVIGWVLLIVVFTGTFVVLLTTPPPLPANLRFVLTPLFATLFLLHALTHLTVLLLDPADSEVRAQPANQVVPEFDRALHRHVIENGRCHLCNITTRGQRTKHCSVCNKCVPRFDHHCKWLNHCIGGRNYPAFLACLASTLVIALGVTALAVSQLVLVNTNLIVSDQHSGGNSSDTSMNNVTASSPLWPAPGTGSLVLVTVVGVLSAIAAVLLIHLCFFHGYIACLGLTTYEYVRNKREKSIASDGVATDNTRTASSDDGTPSLFCRNNPLFGDDIGTMTRVTTATTDVYVRSTHEEMCVGKDAAENGEDVFPKTLPSTRVSRNFRLCFSYDSRTTETSIEVSSLPSRTTDVSELKNHVESPDAKSSSTPSPVSCCFSIINHPDSRHDRNRKRSETTKRSCGTMRRIQTFLQARLRKNSRQRSSTTISSSAAHRHCGNRIIPQAAGSPDVADPAERENQIVETLTMPLNLDPRLPARLPALELPRAVQIGKVPPGPGDISILGLTMTPSTAMSKWNQTHLRTRRSTSFSKKRPRFKVGSHIVTQTVAQLSPIPESEFSKPATPRSPSRSGPAFVFPPLRE
ncbi:uncharacterized protein [Linepithema humile]|uniref:uncharacterized protein isoform X1 n=1 Tax=Linepithema humile TaxID=83485 RepID=UPI000623B6CC|nr:PREDICTED: uncharacterized protein LOC105679267 isoform X1 [Linepithema humile]